MDGEVCVFCEAGVEVDVLLPDELDDGGMVVVGDGTGEGAVEESGSGAVVLRPRQVAEPLSD